jgi:hypothetical protein
MSKIEKKNNNIDGHSIDNKKYTETNIKTNLINHVLKKKTKITNINELFLKCNNYSFNKNKKPIHKNIFMEELLSQKTTEKESDNSKIKTQRKISINNSDINSFAIKSETNTDIKKISERRMFEYKINKKFQAVKQKMQINKNRKKKWK